MIDWPTIDASIGSRNGTAFVADNRVRVGGGSISEAWRIENAHTRYFVKLNAVEREPMFAAEAAGLVELRQAVGLRVPWTVALGATAAHAFLVLEYIELREPTPRSMVRLGEALADMHGVVSTRYGWDRDNTIGSNMQHNTPHPHWREFWRENRLAVMLDALAPDHPRLGRDGDALLAVLDDLLVDHQPEASLVHGDLWGGNVAMDNQGVPVLFDPAVYYGDRETDLAIAELFGGFLPLFFEAYWGAWPMSPGYRQIRRPLYQLYHMLNHARLFGGHYVEESRRLIRVLLAQC